MRACVWVVAFGGCSGSSGRLEPVSPSPVETSDTGASPVFAVGAQVTPDAGPVPLPVTFDATGSPGDCTWALPDGTELAGCHAEWTFLAAGSAAVRLTVRGADGARATADAIVEVGAQACPVPGVPVTLGSLTTDQIHEASGVVEGRANPGILWTHNDNPDPARLFAVDATGALRGTWGASVGFDDAEDLAIGPAPGGGAWLYVGDIGDNDRERESIQVVVFEEPEVPVGSLDGALAHVATLTMRYPAAPQNSETLLLDPVTGSLFVVTKNISGFAEIYEKPAPHADGDDVVLTLVATLDFSTKPLSGATPTAGDIAPLGNQILIRTYREQGFVWLRDGAQTVPEALLAPPCSVALPDEPQSESVGYASDGQGVWTISEQALQPVYFTPFGA